MRKSGSSLLLLPILLATLFWALGHPLGRIILQTVHPFQLGSMTLAIGFLCVFLYLAAARRLPLAGPHARRGHRRLAGPGRPGLRRLPGPHLQRPGPHSRLHERHPGLQQRRAHRHPVRGFPEGAHRLAARRGHPGRLRRGGAGDLQSRLPAGREHRPAGLRLLAAGRAVLRAVHHPGKAPGRAQRSAAGHRAGPARRGPAARRGDLRPRRPVLAGAGGRAGLVADDPPGGLDDRLRLPRLVRDPEEAAGLPRLGLRLPHARVRGDPLLPHPRRALLVDVLRGRSAGAGRGRALLALASGRRIPR